ALKVKARPPELAEPPAHAARRWDTPEISTYRHEKLPAYQSGRKFDDALRDRRGLFRAPRLPLPSLVARSSDLYSACMFTLLALSRLNQENKTRQMPKRAIIKKAAITSNAPVLTSWPS
ncbi:MAG: hypothetical protein WA441_01710, partial [Methyloceanibacter sp.]